jgi:hypothetical protein
MEEGSIIFGLQPPPFPTSPSFSSKDFVSNYNLPSWCFGRSTLSPQCATTIYCTPSPALPPSSLPLLNASENSEPLPSTDTTLQLPFSIPALIPAQHLLSNYFHLKNHSRADTVLNLVKSCLGDQKTCTLKKFRYFWLHNLCAKDFLIFRIRTPFSNFLLERTQKLYRDKI